MDRDTLYSAHILHRRPYTNTSLLLEFFTAEHGRFPALAKGVLSSKRPDGAVLQPFQPLLIKLTGRGEVKTLTMGEADGSMVRLQGRALYCGFYINELVMRLLGRNVAHAELYRCYVAALSRLSQISTHASDIEPVLRLFEVDLLRELGYDPMFEHTLDGSEIVQDAQYQYRLEEGLVSTTSRGSGVISGCTILALSGQIEFGELERDQARRLMRRILAHYLGDKPLKSRELFQLTGVRSSG